VVANINIIFPDGSDRIVNSSHYHIVGDATTILVRRAAVFSSTAFRSLRYCVRNPTEKSNKLSPARSAVAKVSYDKSEPFVFSMSDQYEDRDGYVEWTRDDSGQGYIDEYESLGFDRSERSNYADEDSDYDEYDGDADGGAHKQQFSQEY